MKRLLLILSLIFSFAAGMQAQTPYLETGDIVSIHYGYWEQTSWWPENVYEYRTNYMEASNSGIKMVPYATDNCLWELTVENNAYAFRDLTTGQYLRIKDEISQESALILADNASAFYFTDKGGEKGKYMFGQLYYNTVTPWGSPIALLMSQYQDIFMVAGWNPSDLYIEKWEQKGAGKPTGHFNPSKIEFSYAKDEKEAAEQARDVTFMIEATTESYYQCIRRQDEALLRRTTNNVAGEDVKIVDIYWESDSINRQTSPNDLESNLNITADKYIDCPETDGRAILSLSQPTGGQDGKWQFTITPEGASPMGLKQKIYEETVNGTTVGIDRWVDYADRVVVEYQYGESEPQKAHMRVVRKSYREEELPALTFSINPLTYNFNPAGESKVFDVKAMHQHGKVIYNVDDQVIKTTYENETPPQEVDLEKANITYSFINNNVDNWLTYEVYSSNQIMVTASSNEGEGKVKRSDTLVVTMTPQNHSDHTPMSFSIPLDQRAKIIPGGIQFIPNQGVGNTSFETNPYTHKDQQKVHTVEKTIYYLPNQAEIELRLQESGYSGYMRWYDYETGGDPYYNYTHEGKQATSWVRSPRGNQDKAFSAINTPRKGNTPEEMNNIIAKEGHSHGLYSLNKADGGALDEDNPYNNNPIIKGWEDGAAHIMACDVSAYTDYTIEKDNHGQITSITEPTLSYRQIFHLKPASEMADMLKEKSERGEYLENYKYQAPAGKQILLATQYRYKKARSHSSEMCYFFTDIWGTLRSINSSDPVQWFVQTKDKNGNWSEEEPYDATYSAEMDYLIVRNETYTYPSTYRYSLKLPKDSKYIHEDYTTDLLIARFEVEFVDIEKQGPTPQTIITQQRINSQYKTLTAPITFDNITTHLPWEQASYGYVYDETTELGKTAADGTTKYKRGASQGCFPFYGEYTVLASVDKGWAQATAHGGTGKSLYVDGTMEPGLVASIEANATICTGQTMYCSAWFCNPTPSGWSGEGNPIFRCNIQGRNKNEQEWHDAGVYFVGELLKGTGWQQVVFPIESAHSYDQTRVSIYNFATTNQGNDFMVDDINLYVSQLPIAAYQGKMACRTTGDGSTTAAAILRLDYSNINAGSNGYMYYQIYNDSFESKVNPNDEDTIGGYPVTLTGDAAYYHDNTAHTEEDHAYGSVTIPAADYNPESDNKVLDQDYFYSVSRMLDYMAEKDLKKFKAYVKTENSGVVKWLLYVAHFVKNVSETDVNDNKNMPLQALYDQHEYTMRMAYSPGDLSQPACNLQTPLHATQKTVFRLRNSDGDVIKHDNDHQATKEEGERDINRVSTLNCANDLYFLTAKIINNLSLGGAGGSLTRIEAPIYADWLVGEDFDDVYNNGRPETGSDDKIKADAAFEKKYGYTRGQIASAVMYDMRRIPTDDEPNPNYTAHSLKELQPSAFESYQNYEIVKHLCDSGWLQMYDTTVHFYLGSGETARYWCFPIEGTAKYNETVTLKDCNEPRWVSISSQESDYYLNLAPIENSKKTNQQKTQIPAIKVLEDSEVITFEIKDISGTMSGSGKEQVFTPNVQVGNTNTIDGKSFVRLNLKAECQLMDMELGQPLKKPLTLEPGKEYTVRLQLTDPNNKWEYIGGDESNCLVGYVFVTIQVVPKTLVWTPDGTTFTGWGLNDNWIGWKDKNEDGEINKTDDPATNEVFAGFVPISGADVIIPKLDNPLAYPYIVHEGDTEHGHKHNHYPMTIDFQPHHCNYIYFAPGAKLHNQHVLQYNRAFVDMQITAGKWNMMSAPLQDMVSGDMFIPHEGDWRNGRKIDEPNPFEVSTFEGRRDGNAAYTFAQAFYNTSVDILYEAKNGVEIKQSSSLEFTRSNTMAQALTPGTGYQLYGLGKQENETLTVRLPKTDTEYYYYTTAGTPSTQKDGITRTAGLGKLAYTPSNDGMEITLNNNQANTEFLFGNPTMAYIDMRALYKDNQGDWTGNFKRMTNSSWISVTQLTMASERYLAPMTSVLLQSTSSTKKMQISLKPEHLTLNNTVNPNRAPEEESNPEQSPARRMAIAERPIPQDERETEKLTIYALGKNAHARIVLATNPAANDYYQVGEDALFVSTGVESTSAVTSPLNMYTVAEQVPMMADVRQGISEIPVAILAANNARSEYMQLAFYYTSNWSRTCYFVDHKTGQKVRIMDGLVISVEMPKNHEQRYYIEGPDVYQGSNGVVTSTTQPTLSTTGNKVWAYAPDRGNVVVSSTDLIKNATLYDITGRLIAQSPNSLITNSLTLHTAGTAGVYIVDVTLRDGSTERAQVIVQ